MARGGAGGGPSSACQRAMEYHGTGLLQNTVRKRVCVLIASSARKFSPEVFLLWECVHQHGGGGGGRGKVGQRGCCRGNAWFRFDYTVWEVEKKKKGEKAAREKAWRAYIWGTTFRPQFAWCARGSSTPNTTNAKRGRDDG
jgi:hypothetical protein